jgi:hypothetical protein
MTHFYVKQLQILYRLFDLEGYVLNTDPDGDGRMSFYTGHSVGNSQCRYCINPEEAFLFTMTKVATGRRNQSIVDEYFGGNYARWSFAFPWMVRYLNNRYKDIIGHQGLVRFVNDFPRFNERIEQYVKKERLRENPDLHFMLIPGQRFLHCDIFGFIDNSINKISVLFSGPRGDYEGAA